MIPIVWFLVACVLCIGVGVVSAYFLLSHKQSQSKSNAAKILENAYAEAKQRKKKLYLRQRKKFII